MLDNPNSQLGALTLATIWAATPFGLSMGTIATGMCFSLVGVVGRAAFEIQKANEGNGTHVQWAKIAGWLGGGFIGAPFATVFYLVFLKLINVQSDGIAILGLLFFGFSGSKALTWLLNTAIGFLNKKLGTNIPALGASNQEPKP